MYFLSHELYLHVRCDAKEYSNAHECATVVMLRTSHVESRRFMNSTKPLLTFVFLSPIPLFTRLYSSHTFILGSVRVYLHVHGPQPGECNAETDVSLMCYCSVETLLSTPARLLCFLSPADA